MGAGVNGMSGSPVQGSFAQQVNNYFQKYYLLYTYRYDKPL